jgi:hypothetical protein
MVKGKNLQPGMPNIGEGERDDVEPGPHVGDDEPTTSKSAEPAPLFLVGRTRRGRCLNTDLGHYFTGSGPFHHTTIFLIFKLAQICKIPK